MPMPHLQRE